MTTEESRKKFEAWISAEPFGINIERCDPADTWPNQYRYYSTQLAWEAWEQARKEFTK